jgi:hypothetical protein
MCILQKDFGVFAKMRKKRKTKKTQKTGKQKNNNKKKKCGMHKRMAAKMSIQTL